VTYRIQRFDRRVSIDFARLSEAKQDLVARVRRDGEIDMMRVFADATLRGALAELEYDGVLLSAGPVGRNFAQPYRAAEGDVQRTEFRDLRRQRDFEDYRSNSRKGTAANAPTPEQVAAHRAKVEAWRKRISVNNA
jgi:hypothetical protein